MDDGYEQTQALNFDDSGDETDDEADVGADRPPAGYLKVLCQKGHPENSHPLYDGDNIIGRHDSCSIPLPFGSLSREHACIEVKGDTVLIYDKGSRNKTRKNKHFLQPEVRYELRDKDKLLFGDAECIFEAYHKDEGNESGSETGSESMFETAPIDQELDEPKERRTLKLPVDTDYQSDGSSDILQPTQPFGSQKQGSIMKNNNNTLIDQTHNITVKDTPALSRTKKITDNLVLPESGSETDGEDEILAAPTLAAESQQSDGENEAPKKALMGAATQAYVCESEDDTEEEATPKKKSLLMAATQAYVEEEEEEVTPSKKALLTAATQAYVAESDDDTGNEEDTPVKAKRAIIGEPTQAYTMGGGIEPTMAYNMEDEENGEENNQEETAGNKKALLYEPTQAYGGSASGDEDSNPGEVKIQKEAESKKSLMYEPTQAYPGNAGDEDKDEVASETSEEFTLDDDDNEKDEDVSHMFMAPTLACDNVEDSNQSEPSRDSVQELETQVVGEAETQAVGEDQTQVVETDGKGVKADDATQVFTDDAAEAQGGKTKKKSNTSNDGETQVFLETQVVEDMKTSGEKQRTGDEPTQMIPDETQVLDETPEKHKGAKAGRLSEEATQVFTDATLAVEEIEKTQKPGKGKDSHLDSDSEQPTQVFPDGTMAVEDLYRQDKVKQKEGTEDQSEAATQVFEDAAVVQKTKRTRAKGQNKADESKAATQVFDEVQKPSGKKKGNKKTVKGMKVSQETLQMFTQGIEEEENSEKDFIMRAVATLAAEENGEVDEDDSGGTEAEKETGLGSEDATQVFDGSVSTGDMETQPIPGGDVTDTVAVTEVDMVSVTEPEPTLPVTDVEGKTKGKGRGRKGGKSKTKVEIDNEAATQVLPDTETLPITEVEEKPKRRGRKGGGSKNEKETVTESATQVSADMETVPIAEVEEMPKKRGRKERQSKVEMVTEAETQVFADTETQPISEVEETTTSRGRGRKSVKARTETALNEATNIDTEAATQTFETTESLSILEEDNQHKSKETPEVPDIEPETQIYNEEKVVSNEEAVTQVNETRDAEEQPAKRSVRGRKKETAQESAKAVHSSRKQQEDNKEEITEQPAGTRSRGRRGKQAAVNGSSNEAKPKAAPAVGKRKGKKEEPISEEATQAYTGEEATQVYDGEEKGLTVEDDDLTPPLSEEVVPDSEEEMSQVIPAPPLVPIPSRSPHKSALASPGRKNSPSPKRVQFVSQGSEETEPPAGRGRRGRKVTMETSVTEEVKDKKESAVKTQEKPSRRGRRSVQIDNTAAVGQKSKSGRKSLPAVLEDNKEELSVGVENEKHQKDDDDRPKGRKGRNAKEKSKDAVRVPEENSEVSGSENTSDKLNKKAVGKRTTRGKASSEIGVSDKNEDEFKDVTNSDRTSKRQSSRSKSRQTETAESSDNKVTKLEVLENTKDTEIPETSNGTRNKAKSDSQESDIVTKKRGTRKTAIHKGDKLDESKIFESKTEDNELKVAKQKAKGPKTKGKNVSSEQNDAVSDHSEATETVSETSERQSRASRRKGKDNLSQDSQINGTKADDYKREPSVTNSNTKSRTKRKGKQETEVSQLEEQKPETSKSDLKEITNLKNSKHVNDSKASQNEKVKSEKTTGKVTRGKAAAATSGSGDAPEDEAKHTPAKRRKTLPESQTSSTPSNRRATLANGVATKQNSEKTEVGTPKASNKKLDDSLSSSPSLRKTPQAKPKVMFTGVTDEQCEKIVKELGGEMASSVYHCTHLVTDQVRRTVKFLCCLSRGIPICTPQWLMSSKRTSVFSDPWPFLISDNASEKKYKFSLQLSLDKATEKLFLSDYKIHVTKSVKPDPNQMKDIIQCAGAKYLSSIPKTYSDGTVVISCEEDKAACSAALKAGIPVVSSEFILTGALRQETDINSYRLFNGNGDKRKQSMAPDSEPSAKKKK